MDQNTRRFDEQDLPQAEEQAIVSDELGGDLPTRRLTQEDALGTASCPRCGGEWTQVIVGLDVRNGKIVVKRPGTWFGILSGGVSQLDGYSCSNCGYTEFYALTPEAVDDGEEEQEQNTVRLDERTPVATQCIKCGGGLAKAIVGMDVRAGKIVFKRPDGSFARDSISPIDAYCCDNCGYTEFYAATPEALNSEKSEEATGAKAKLDATTTGSIQTNSCVKCDGELNQVVAAQDNRNGSVVVKRPGTWIGVLSGGVSQLKLDSCANCGYTSFFAVNPAALQGKE